MHTVEPRDGDPVHPADRAVRVDLEDCAGAARVLQHPDEGASGIAAMPSSDQCREIDQVAFGPVVIEDAIEERGPGLCRSERDGIEYEPVVVGTSGHRVIAGAAI